MKTKTTISFLFLLLFVTSFTTFAQKADFSGAWTLNREKTVLAENQLFLSKITVQLKPDSLMTNRVYENGSGEEYPFDENLSLDGKDCKIVIFEMPRTSKASKSAVDESLILESITIFNGQYGADSLISKETWKLDLTNKNLIIDFTNKMSGNEIKGTNIYEKVK
jgi:hypothetical protein